MISVPFTTPRCPWSIQSFNPAHSDRIVTPRYRVMFDRIVTPRFTSDLNELRTWQMGIRQVLASNAIMDMVAEEDSAFLRAMRAVVEGDEAVRAELEGSFE